MTPKTAIARHDLSMTYFEFSLRANQRKFVGTQVFPPVGVDMQSADFSKVKVRSVLTPVEDTERAPDGSYRRDKFEWIKDAYATVENGVEEPVSDRRVKMYGDILPAEQIAAARAVNRVTQALESKIATAAFDEAVFTNAAVSAGAWTVQATSKPVDDVHAAIERVIAQCGMDPNVLVITDYAFRALQNNVQIIDRIKYWGGDDPKNVTASALAALFDIEQVVVARGMKLTGSETDVEATPSFTRQWDSTKAGLYHVNRSQDLEDPMPNVGRTIMWSEENAALPGAGSGSIGVIMEEYREEQVRSGVIRARADYQVKTIHAEAGTLITGVTA